MQPVRSYMSLKRGADMIASGPDYPLRRVLRPAILACQSHEAAPVRAAGAV
jgi:hypothetical protein